MPLLTFARVAVGIRDRARIPFLLVNLRNKFVMPSFTRSAIWCEPHKFKKMGHVNLTTHLAWSGWSRSRDLSRPVVLRLTLDIA